VKDSQEDIQYSPSKGEKNKRTKFLRGLGENKAQEGYHFHVQDSVEVQKL
jgi:hypothetical protein